MPRSPAGKGGWLPGCLMNSLICFAAHPDDEALSFGALLTWAARLDWRIHLAWATSGERSTSPEAGFRWQEASLVARLLNADAQNLGLADGQVTTGAFIPRAEKLIRQVSPRVIVWPCGIGPEQHQDHRALHDGMMNIVARSPYSSSCWCIGQPPVLPDPWFCHPHFYLCFDEALLCDSISLMATYRSEGGKHFANPRFLRMRAESWACRTQAEVEFAEPFMLARGIPPGELFSSSVESGSRCVAAEPQMELSSSMEGDLLAAQLIR